MRKFKIIIFILVFFLNIVLPNSFPEASLILLVVSSLYYISRRGIHAKKNTYVLITLSFLTTLTYLLIGSMGNAPIQALEQVSIVYIFTPLLWIFLIYNIFLDYERNTLFNMLGLCSVFSCLSVALFYYLFINFGASAVTIFKEDANLLKSADYAEVTMHVMGSFIFLGSSFFAAPKVIKNIYFRIVVLFMLFTTIMVTGRTASVLALAIGLSFFIIGSVNKNNFRTLAAYVFIIIAVFLVSYFLMLFLIEVDLLLIAEGHYEKIVEGGGLVRSIQISELMDGAIGNYFLGAGHGVGVAYVRSDNFPWRYEAVLSATLYRVGLIGTLIYLMPFAFSTYLFGKRVFARTLSDGDMFFFSAMVSALIAANTNPYFEAFAFQWIYFFPVVYFMAFRRVNTASV
jgi:hypothetical protein